MDWYALITTLIATIAPSVVSIFSLRYQKETNIENNKLQLEINRLNNEHQLAVNNLEFINTQKNLCLSSYLDCLVSYLENPNATNLLHYQSSMSKACMYVSNNIYDEIDSINTAIKNQEFDKIKDYYFSCLLDAINSDTKQNK